MHSTTVMLALSGLLAFSSAAPALQNRDDTQGSVTSASSTVVTDLSSTVADLSSTAIADVSSTPVPASTPSTATNALVSLAPAAAVAPASTSASATCFKRDVIGTIYYNITLSNWPQDQRGCGTGTLDNLRGQCNVITDWKCDYTEGSGNTTRITFTNASANRAGCVKDAIYLASQGAGINPPVEGVSCNDYPSKPMSAGDYALNLGYQRMANAPPGH